MIGHIAKLAGYPTYSRYNPLTAVADVRHVGNAMKMLPTTTDIPWQVSQERSRGGKRADRLTDKRVISAKGIISPRGDEGQGVARQKIALEGEGVEVVTLAGGGGEKVDVRRYGWFPEQVDL
jgi:methylated-DNA-protein-cysteine methyltransferase-like protein